MGSEDSRIRYLAMFSQNLIAATMNSSLDKKPFKLLSTITPICGPRAGALRVLAGFDSGRLLKVLNQNHGANLRNLIPWDFVGDPQAYMENRFIRMEAGWSTDLAETMIPLASLGTRPATKGRWVAGKDENGKTVVPGLSDQTPHFLVSGATGSGKTITLRTAAVQLAADPSNQIVLLDGKRGEGLGRLGGLAVGPVAIEGPEMRRALAWAHNEMVSRYDAGGHDGRVIVIFDEFQTVMGDPVLASLFAELVNQGRAAGVHVIAAAQHPNVDSFGSPTTSRSLVGRLATRVADRGASLVAIGDYMPRADRLLGMGDSLIVVPTDTSRFQGAYVNINDIALPDRNSRLLAWPEYQGENIGQIGPGRPQDDFTDQEWAAGIAGVSMKLKREPLKQMMREWGLEAPGTDRAKRLIARSTGIVSVLTEKRLHLTEKGT